MANQVTCPQLADVLNENECLENRAGVGVTVYLGLKSELSAPLTATENMYSTPSFQAGKGLYKVECKDDTNQIQGSSLGYRKGFELTFTFAIDSVNPAAGKLARAITTATSLSLSKTMISLRLCTTQTVRLSLTQVALKRTLEPRATTNAAPPSRQSCQA